MYVFDFHISSKLCLLEFDLLEIFHALDGSMDKNLFISLLNRQSWLLGPNCHLVEINQDIHKY